MKRIQRIVVGSILFFTLGIYFVLRTQQSLYERIAGQRLTMWETFCAPPLILPASPAPYCVMPSRRAIGDEVSVSTGIVRRSNSTIWVIER